MIQEALNHQFFEMMRREHRELTDVIGTLREQLQEKVPAAEALRLSITKLADLALGHFEHEEHGGYLCEVIEQAPRLSERAETLKAQHATMRDDLSQLVELVDQVAAGQMSVNKLRENLNAFLRSLLDHESAENELVQEAYTDDIGSKD
ncbi:MAG: hemerythrin domain-containing protein [Planctomycetales bacterium]|nr:hemerythrin domain-containing protein [Planctomycetales bacterium]